ncbi:MAG: hypothetical protein JPMHGGIA_00777 [Saprospiraceae bacterium]|nr:hypothetical protein [Saprospiraceae bacterium]
MPEFAQWWNPAPLLDVIYFYQALTPLPIPGRLNTGSILQCKKVIRCTFLKYFLR